MEYIKDATFTHRTKQMMQQKKNSTNIKTIHSHL